MTMTFEAVVFDLDGTLYDTDAMDKANRFACVSAIAEFFELSTGEAERKIGRNAG
jgi:FMN phosphatase YigB (HAD superfamily)